MTAQYQSAEIAYLIRISYRKAVDDVSILERKLISVQMYYLMLNFSLDTHIFCGITFLHMKSIYYFTWVTNQDLNSSTFLSQYNNLKKIANTSLSNSQ